MTDDLHDAATDLADAAEDVADAAESTEQEAAAEAAVDTEPIADAIEDAADTVIQLDHEGRLARLESELGTHAHEHTHDEFAYASHTHEELTPAVEDIPVPEAPEETTDSEPEPEDEAPKRSHWLTWRPFAKG